MQDCATSMDSLASDGSVPSVRDVERKSIIARASRFFESVACYVHGLVSSRGYWAGRGFGTMTTDEER